MGSRIFYYLLHNSIGLTQNTICPTQNSLGPTQSSMGPTQNSMNVVQQLCVPKVLIKNKHLCVILLMMSVTKIFFILDLIK